MTDAISSEIGCGIKRRFSEVEDDQSPIQPINSPSKVSASEKKSPAILSNQQEECQVMKNDTSSTSELSANVFHNISGCHSPGENSEDYAEANQQLGFLCQSGLHHATAENPEITEASGEKIVVCDSVNVSSIYGESTGNLVDKVQNLVSVPEKESFKVDTVHDFETSDAVEVGNQDVIDGVEEKDLARNKVGCDGNQESENPGKFTGKKRVQELQVRAAIDANGKAAFARTEELLREEADSECFLEMKKKLLLEELEAMLVPEDEIHLEKVNYSPSLGGLVDNGSKMMLIVEERIANQQNDPENMNVLRRSNVSLRNSVKIEVIDETALVEPVHVSKNGDGEEISIVCPARSTQIKSNKFAETETGGKKNKRSRRRARESKIPEIYWKLGNVNELNKVHERQKDAEGNRIMYLRKELEAMRFVNVVEQRKLWKAIYKELMPSVAREYSSLTSINHQKKTGSSSDPRQHLEKREEASTMIRKTCSESLDGVKENMEADNEIKILSSSYPSCSLSVSDGSNTVLEEECSEDSGDDKYYNSIQRPAFLVEGEPNFDSGPPEDGLEYLRRVRWEASRIPNVTVANVDRSNFKREQSVYMPMIPVIAKCPEHLLPSKQWEDAFLADFSELRQALSCYEDRERIAEDSGYMQSDFILHEKLDSIIPNLIDQPSILPDGDIDSQQPQKLSVKEHCSDYPSLSAILKMDSVFRVSSLRRRISSVETQTTLSRIDCVWMFALSAVVDTPLDADTCAAFRSLLRKCASLRAGKADLDDEVIMLNILATISGRYFGQSEN